MADLTLRGQCRRARDLVRADRAAEAVILCSSILKSFPRHIGACNMLAQAHLALGQLDESASLFQRVLSADPEHTGACVGLATIYEEQAQPDEALWHLQRAFELSPGSVSIRRELRRMYQERGLSAVERIQLTRAALARTYTRGQLYAKAVRELRELQATGDPRFDLRVALAEALWLGKLCEDAETVCQALLVELPDCLKANLILGQVWLNTEKDDQARALLQRAQTLDPENVTAQALLGERSPLPPRVVRLPLRDEDVPPLEPPYLGDEEDSVSDYGTVPEERTEPLGSDRGLDGAKSRDEPMSHGPVTSSFSAGSPSDAGPVATTRMGLTGDAPTELAVGLTYRGTTQDALLGAKQTDVAAIKERQRGIDSRREVEKLAAAINWEGMSLIDVRRQYVEDHPEDHEARLDLARRYRDALKLNDALEHYARLVEQDYEMLREVVHDLDLLNRLYPRTLALQQLLAAARRKGHRDPPQWQ